MGTHLELRVVRLRSDHSGRFSNQLATAPSDGSLFLFSLWSVQLEKADGTARTQRKSPVFNGRPMRERSNAQNGSCLKVLAKMELT